MYKYLIASTLFLAGCANFTVNGTMCDDVALQPNETIPQECRNYDEKAADKAFNKVVEDKKISDKDLKVEEEE